MMTLLERQLARETFDKVGTCKGCHEDRLVNTYGRCLGCQAAFQSEMEEVEAEAYGRW